MTGSRTSESGRIGSAARRCASDEASEQDDRRGKPQAARPGVATDRDQQRADSREEQRRPQPVNLHLPRQSRGGIRERDDGHAAESERHVQIEDPPPRQCVRDVAADERAGDRRHTPDAAEECLCPCALRQRVELADDRHAHRDDGARAEPLNRPGRNQREHARRRTRHHRTDQENSDAQQIHATSCRTRSERRPQIGTEAVDVSRYAEKTQL